jgi:formamidopyrimidine-DNA glycosylase
MPELPEVETIRIGLESMIRGAEINHGEIVGFPGVIEPLAIDQLNAAIAGQEIVAVRRRAKYLLFDLSNDLTLIVHLRMTGQLLVTEPTPEPSRFERFRFVLHDGREVRYIDQRKFGRISLADAVALERLDRNLGVEPLGEEFTAAWLAGALAKKGGQIKPVLLDQRVIAGIGNIYADESLFRSGIHPQLPANRLTEGQIAELHSNLRYVLNGSIDRGGTTFSSYRNASGESGTNQLTLQVYGLGRGDTPCPRCGGPLTCLKVAGRSSHLCPVCQQPPNTGPDAINRPSGVN